MVRAALSVSFSLAGVTGGSNSQEAVMKRSLSVLAALAAVALGQYWTGPFQLTSDPHDDINPSVCKEWVLGNMTGLVWQTNRNGNWDIFSKFGSFYNGNGWGSEIPVSQNPADDVNPVVAACNDGTDHPSFWCAWERRDSPIVGSIWVAFYTFRDSWLSYEQIGRTIRLGQDSAEPSMIVIKGSSRDTAWVIWRNRDTSGSFISYCYHDGSSWSEPGIVAASGAEMHHARLGRGCGSRNQWRPYPLVTWEQNGDIYYSEFLNGAWSAPAQVAPAPANDLNPEVVSFGSFPLLYTGWIVWQSDRDGDTAIFGTRGDTFSLCDRWCDTTGAGRNWSPAGASAAFTTDAPPWGVVAAWVSDRAGNPDIYSSGVFYPGDAYVDSNPAIDASPSVTVLGLTQVWCCWQSNRSGNWDIFGSYIYSTGIREQGAGSREQGAGGATIGHNGLRLPAHGELLDISGRRVMKLRPGANRVSGLVPGVYFVRQDGAAVGKVVIAR